ncbi:hypothetical protein MASR1M12_03010 [Erysipelotrichia bacterium]
MPLQVWGAIVTAPNRQNRVNVPVTGLENMKTAFFSLDYDKEFTMVFTAYWRQQRTAQVHRRHAEPARCFQRLGRFGA